MSIRGAKEHSQIDFYQECMTFKPLHYRLQDTIGILLDKGLTLDQAIRELPIYSQVEARKIYQRG